MAGITPASGYTFTLTPGSVGEATVTYGLSLVDDLAEAIERSAGLTLDNLGLQVRAPVVPQPAPDPAVLAKLCRMYGEPPWPTGEPSAAYRTAVAMERRRQGWTREGELAGWRQRALRAIQEQAAGAGVAGA